MPVKLEAEALRLEESYVGLTAFVTNGQFFLFFLNCLDPSHGITASEP